MPRITMMTSAAYQFTGICPRYVVPPPVAAARATDFPEELLAMAGGNPTAWRGALLRQATRGAGHGRGPSSQDGGSPRGPAPASGLVDGTPLRPASAAGPWPHAAGPGCPGPPWPRATPDTGARRTGSPAVP